jgi:hypothetical protein
MEAIFSSETSDKFLRNTRSYVSEDRTLHIYRCDNLTLIDTSKEVGLEVNGKETKFMLLSRHQNAGQNYDVEKADRCFENVATTITNQNLIQEEIKRRLNWGNACYHSVPIFCLLVCCLKT